MSATAGTAFIVRDPATGQPTIGTGDYFGMPIKVHLAPAERDGVLGFVMTIVIAPAEDRKDG